MHVCNTHKNVRSVRAVYVHQVRASCDCVYTPVAHAVVATTWVRTPKNVSTTIVLKNETKNSSLHDHLESTPSALRHIT